MKVTYIYHSGFVLEEGDVVVVIDFFKDPSPRGKLMDELLTKTSRSFYVLSSHAHFDHFNPEVLEWSKRVPDIKYILSKDISDTGIEAGENIFFLDKPETYRDTNLFIQAFGSTDAGVSFLMEWNGKTIFHAGDLNNWHWSEESTEIEIKAATRAFLSELTILEKAYTAIDVVFFPVDPRQGKDYMRGAEQFLERISVKHFIPMHFGGAYDKALAFKPYVESKGGEYITFRHPGDCIHFK